MNLALGQVQLLFQGITRPEAIGYQVKKNFADINPSPNNQPAGKGPIKETVVKIDSAIKSPPIARGKDARPTATRLMQPAESPAISDDVRLTDTSGKIRQLESDLGNLDISDTVKIESIRQAIADGNFKVDEEAVAEGLIQESIATISRRSRQ